MNIIEGPDFGADDLPLFVTFSGDDKNIPGPEALDRRDDRFGPIGNDRYRDTPSVIKATTNAEGVFTFTPELPGPYWFTAGTEGDTVVDGMPMKVRSSYTATFEALPL